MVEFSAKFIRNYSVKVVKYNNQSILCSFSFSSIQSAGRKPIIILAGKCDHRQTMASVILSNEMKN